MCKVERRERGAVEMGLKPSGGPVSATTSPRSQMKLWMVRAATSLLLWTCIVQFTTLGETWGPRLLKGWPSCHSQAEEKKAVVLESKVALAPPLQVLPPKSELNRYSGICITEPVFSVLIAFSSLSTPSQSQRFILDSLDDSRPYLSCSL